jgi:hypothetical protein
MIDATAVALLLDELDYSEGLYECYGETYAQYRSEMGRYGDAWPGSYDQITGMEDAIREVEQLAALVDAISPPWVDTLIDPGYINPLFEEPF